MHNAQCIVIRRVTFPGINVEKSSSVCCLIKIQRRYACIHVIPDGLLPFALACRAVQASFYVDCLTRLITDHFVLVTIHRVSRIILSTLSHFSNMFFKLVKDRYQMRFLFYLPFFEKYFKLWRNFFHENN